MSTENTSLPSRRQVLKATGGLAATALLPTFGYSRVHPGGSDLIRVALVGCGGRGGGAAVNAISTTSGPIKLVAMADVFQDRLDQTRDNLVKDYGAKMDVPKERQFIGFDAYKHAMDALKPGDVVILTTPPAFRWVHFTYAISKKLNVFMEKPVTVDGPTSRKMLKLADEATAANLKVGVGLMSRHARNIQELHERVSNGEIGDVVLMRGYRMQGVGADSSLEPETGERSRRRIPDSPLPCLPVGERRTVQRLFHSPHRPPLLDEECLAGKGPGSRWQALQD